VTVNKHSLPDVNSTINVSFRDAESDSVRALRTHYGLHLRLRLDVVVTVILMAIGAWLWRLPDVHWFGVGCVIISVGFFLMLAAAFTIIPQLVFRREPKFRDYYSLTFSSEGIHFRTSHVDSQLQWSMYSRAVVDAHSYLLYYGARQLTVIPKRVFQSGGSTADVRAVAYAAHSQDSQTMMMPV